MPQFIFRKLKDEQVRDPAILNKLVSGIKNAFDIMRTNNFGGSVPHTSLENDKTYVPMKLWYNGSIVGPAAGTSAIQVPLIETGGSGDTMVLKHLFASGSVSIGGGACSLAVYYDKTGPALLDTLVLDGADDDPQTDDGVVNQEFDAGDLFYVTATVPGGTTLSDFTVIGLFEVPHGS